MIFSILNGIKVFFRANWQVRMLNVTRPPIPIIPDIIDIFTVQFKASLVLGVCLSSLILKLMITIIIPTYNSDKFLKKCLETIRQQKRELFELIIIDNSSSDSTLKTIDQFSDIVDILISEPDSGNYAAINKGISFSKGSWVYILGADDFLFDQDTIADASKFLETCAEDIYIVYGKVSVIDNEGHALYQSGDEWSKCSTLFKSRMTIPHQGVFHRLEAFNKFGRFDTQFKYAGDYDLLMRIVDEYPPKFLDKIIAAYRFTGGSSQVMAALEVQKEYRLAQKKNSHALTFVWMVGYVRTFLRLMIWRILGNKFAAKVDDFFRALLGKKPIWTKIFR